MRTQRGGRPLKRHRDGLAPQDAVGPDAANRRPDVARVEALLGGAGALDVSATEGPTGYFGRRTDAAIRKVQRERRLKVDGLITPKGPTLKALMASLPRAPVPAFAVPKPGTKVGREARAANGRLVDAVMKTRSAGIVPKLLADAAAQGPSGEAEVADFFAQLARRDTPRARDMATLVAAERTWPGLEGEGREPDGREGSTRLKGPDNRPPDAAKQGPSPRPKGNPCESYAFDVEDALNAHAAKAAELREVENEIRENGFKLQDLKTLQAELRELGDDTLPWRAIDPDDPKFSKLLKTVAKWSDIAHVANYLIRFSTKPHNPFTLGSEIAELEARQAELEARREELENDVEELQQRYLKADAQYQACLAEHDFDPKAPNPGPDAPPQAPTA